MIYLRAADRFDSGALAQLRVEALIELEILDQPDADGFAAQALREFDTLFRDERVLAWIACDGDRVVASCCVIFYDRLPYPDGSRHAELCGVYVLPAYRKRGFASELVREVMAAARAAGARKTFLRPSKTAKNVYTRLGFVETDLLVFDHRSTESRSTATGLAVSPGR